MQDRCNKTMHAIVKPNFTLSQTKHPHPGYNHSLVKSTGYMQWHYQESYFNEKMIKNAPSNTSSRRQEPFQRTNLLQGGILEAEWNYYRTRNSQERCPKFDRLMPARSRAAPIPFKRGSSRPCSSMARTYSKIEISVKTGNVVKYSANDKQYANLTNPVLSTASGSRQREKIQLPNSNLEAKRYPSEDKIRMKSITANREPKISYNNPTQLKDKRAQLNQIGTQKANKELENSEETVETIPRLINRTANEAQPQVGKISNRALKCTRQAQTFNETETVDKKSRTDSSPDFGFIENLNLHIGTTYLTDSRKETSTNDLDKPIKYPSKQIPALKYSNQVPFRKNKERSKSFCLISKAPLSRTILLKAKSLTHLTQLEGLDSLKLADCGKYIRSWPVPQLPHFDLPKSPRHSLNHWKEASVSDLSRAQNSSDVIQVDCTDISPLRKKRKRICFIDSSDEEAEPSNKKNRKGFDNGRAGRKSEAKKSKPLDTQKSKHLTTKSLIYDGQVKNAVTRKQMFLMLFGEDSENDEDASQKSSAAPKSSTQEKKSHRNRQKSKHEKGNHGSNKRHTGGAKFNNKHDSLERAKSCTGQSEHASSRKLILTDLFPDPSQEFIERSANKTKKQTIKTVKPPSHQDTKTQTPSCVKQRSKQDGKPTLTSNIRPKVKGKNICMSEIDNKLTSSDIPCKSFPESRFAMHKELVVELQSCSTLSLSNWPTHQKAKAASEKEHCTETCYTNEAVDEKIASKVLKTKVVVKQEEVDDSCLMVYTCVKIQNDSEEAQGFKMKDEPIETFKTEPGKSQEAAIEKHFSDPSQDVKECTEDEHRRAKHQAVNQTIIENIQEFTSAPGASLTYQCPEPTLASSQQCFIEFETTLPLSSAAPFATQQAKTSKEEQHCQETCQVNDAADVKNDSQVVESVVEVDQGVITLYSCTEVQDDDDEVQIVSVTVPVNTKIINRPKEEQADTSLNAMSFVVDLHSMGSALISCEAVSQEPKDRPSTSILPAQSSRRLTCPTEHSLTVVSRAETVIESVLDGSVGKYLPPRAMISTQPQARLTAPHLVQLGQYNSSKNLTTSKRMHKEPESIYVPSSSRVSSQPNVPQCTASAVVQSSLTPQDHLVLSVRDRALIEQILFSHIYFLMHLLNAQWAYLDCLQGRHFCQYYFKCEMQWFEKDKNRRITSQSRQMCMELSQLHIKASKNLTASAQAIVDSVIEKLLKADMNKQVSRSGVYLCLWMLMSGHADIYASVPLLKVMLRHASLVFNKLNSRYSLSFSQEMRQTLIWQIQQYNRLVGWGSRTERDVEIASQLANAPTLTLYPQNRFGNGGSVHNNVNAAGFSSVNQQPIGSPTVQTSTTRVVMCSSPSSSFPTQNTMFNTAKRLETDRGQVPPGYKPMASLRLCGPRGDLQPVNLGPQMHTTPTVYQQSARRLSELSSFQKSFGSINDNFRIRLPYSRPITSVTTCSKPLTSMVYSSPDTPPADDGLAKEPSKLLNQGVGALSLIGQSSLMLACNNSKQELTKRVLADTSGSLPSVDSLQQDKAAAGSPAPTCTAGAPDVKPVQRNDSSCPAEARARCSPSSEEVETIDLTWLDDIDEAELNEEMKFVCVKPELRDECSEITQEGDEDVIYTIVYDTNVCICGETPKYSCNCGKAWYCGKACQLQDWESHRQICQVVSERKKTDLPLPVTHPVVT